MPLYTRTCMLPYVLRPRVPSQRANAGSFLRSMYGTRAAALNWQRELTRILKKNGFSPGKASPCTFSHDTRNISLFVHGDDFLSSGSRQDLEWLRNVLSKEWSIKSTIIGNDDDLPKELRVLNRIVRWHANWGATYEPDSRHVDIIIKDMEATSM